jgi:hypothetical protein
VSAVLTLAVVGLILAMIGLFNGVVALAVALLIAPAVARLWPKHQASEPRAAWWLAGLVAAVSIVGNAAFPAEQFIGGRDGGTYLATAAWLSSEGELLLDARVGPFARDAELEFGGPGFYDSRDDGRLSPQFLHGFPVVAASVDSVGGDSGLIRANALLAGIALLVVFGFARLLLGGWLALLVQVTLGTNLVFGFYARAPFSEILAMLFIFGGLWVLWEAFAQRSARGGLLAGLLIGASLLTRIDSLVLLISVLIILSYHQRRPAAEAAERAVARAALRGLLPMLLLALVDLAIVTPDYLANQRRNVVPIFVALVLVVAADGLAGRWLAKAADKIPTPWRNRAAWVASGIVGVFAVFVYFVRPFVQEVAGSPYLRLAMDSAELAAGEARLFSENSARWLGWYLGPAAAIAGLAGWATLTRRILTGRDKAALAFLALFSAMGVLYIWRPSINPDHIWAMRRFLPVVIPGIIILAALIVRLLWRLRSKRLRVPGRTAAAVLTVLIVGGGLAVSVPLADLHEFDGLGHDVRTGCALMGADAAVLIVDASSNTAGQVLSPTFRAHCGLPTAHTTNTDAAFVESLARAWAAEGNRMWLLSLDRPLLESFGHGAPRAVLVGTYDVLELTFTRRPTGTTPFEVAVFGVEVGGGG